MPFGLGHVACDPQRGSMAATPEVGPVGDLPNEVGEIAARRLSLDGVLSVEQVTRRPRKELLAIHGVDPKAMRILDEAFAAESLGHDGF